jgi:hypothetical protein
VNLFIIPSLQKLMLLFSLSMQDQYQASHSQVRKVSLSKICLDDNIDLYNEKELNESSDDGTK